MKNIHFFLMAALLLLMAGCEDGNSPKGVAKKFLQAFYNGDYETAKEYATEETIKVIEFRETMQMFGAEGDFREVEIVDEKIDGDYAVVTYKLEGEDDEQELRLHKTKDKGWLVIMHKSDLEDGSKQDGEQPDMPPPPMPADTQEVEIDSI